LANHSFACESCARTACSTHRVAFLIDHRTIFRHSVLEITGRSIAPNSIISLWQNRLSFRLLDRARPRFIPRIRKNLAEVLWLIGQEALASGARQIAEVVRRFLAWTQYCARLQTACSSAMANVQRDNAASMPGSRRWRRIGCLTSKSGERVSCGNHQGQSQHCRHFSFYVEHFVSP
jgi:hypothetical protein